MRKKKTYGALALAVLVAVASTSMVCFAKEERTPVGKVKLTITSDIRAGDQDGGVDVSVDGNCSLESADVVNEGFNWVGGEKPKVEIWLSADSDCYFNKTGKSAFTIVGDGVKYVSSHTEGDKEEMVVTVRLDKLDEDDEDLDVNGLTWDEENAIAHWNHLDIAKDYRVRLCRKSNNSYSDDGIGITYTVTENSYDFSGKITRPGTYYFKIRAIDSGNNGGDWEESYNMEITADDLVRFKGEWHQDDKGWWYANRSGSYTKNDWQQIDSQWYFFDQDGYMKTGWIQWGDKQYFCQDFGAMMVSGVTPDGFTVGEDGARVN